MNSLSRYIGIPVIVLILLATYFGLPKSHSQIVTINDMRIDAKTPYPGFSSYGTGGTQFNIYKTIFDKKQIDQFYESRRTDFESRGYLKVENDFNFDIYYSDDLSEMVYIPRFRLDLYDGSELLKRYKVEDPFMGFDIAYDDDILVLTMKYSNN